MMLRDNILTTSKGKEMEFNYTIKKAVKEEMGLIDVDYSIDLSTEASVDWAVDKGFTKFADMTLDSNVKPGVRLTYKPYIETKEWTKYRNMLYVISIDGRIVKIGMTTTGLSKRWGSYNNGTPEIREGKGSGSTTNYNVVQPLKIAIEEGRNVEWYCWAPPVKTYTNEAWGYTEEVQAKDPEWYENLLLTMYEEEFGKKPHLSSNK